ncbi:histidinol-phosphate transaminase [Brevibacillus sp. NRS-1366]|uniref:histidinol-phosphate transaminase n=1 Tax=Brevibacillus sp. NRS-1366 TaxID=3233899 RepID=UPI003D22C8FD
MSNYLWRNSVKQLKPYVPGKPIEEVKNELGLEKITRLASNENPFGVSPKAITAMQKAVEEGYLYPEGTCGELREKLADEHGISADQVLVANGADHMIKLIAAAYINPGDEVIYCTPTFATYRSAVLLMEGIPVEIPTKNDTFDLDAIRLTINDKTKMIFICNPNNPTGTIVDEAQLHAFLKQVPGHVIVVLDEAYIEFVQSAPYKNGLDYLREGFRLITIRTFSKLYGLAGLRVGYAMAPKEYLMPVGAVREHFAVNRIAVSGALAALDDMEFREMTLRENRAQMDYLVNELCELGFHVKASHTNFLFIDTKRDAALIYQGLMKEGILVRPCAAWGLPQHLRITIGTAQQNQELLEALAAITLSIQESKG